MYDFNHLMTGERGASSAKWAQMKKINPNLPQDIIPLSVADMEFKNPPAITEGLQEFLSTAILGYSYANDEYKEMVQAWMQKRHGWEIESEWIVTSNGVVAALYDAVRAYTEPGDGVIIMVPVYYPFYSAIRTNGREVVRNPLIIEQGKYTIDFDDLERCAEVTANKLLIFCSPHNPVGRVWEREELLRVADICLRHNIVMVSDEIHFDLILPGHRHTVWPTLSDRIAERCVVCTAPSKTFNLAGLKASNIIIADAGLRQRFKDEQAKTGNSGLNIMAYKACELAYRHGEVWLDELLQTIDQNRLRVEQFVRQHIPAIQVFPLEGTYLQWWDCRGLGLEYQELERFMVDQAWLFLDEGYWFGEEGQGFERVNLACPPMVLSSALERLKQAWQKHGLDS